MDSAYNDSTGSSEHLASHRSPAAVRVDNLLRRALRVSNPYDAKEMADGLVRYFDGAKRTLELEEAGLPFYRVEVVRTGPRDGEGPSAVELAQARDDVMRDLDSLIHNALLKDIQPELKGWQATIEELVARGSHSARSGLDPRQRDGTFAIRRMLGDYARIARFVGALTPTLNLQYRRFAQSLDEVASVLLVMLGDSLARVGFGSGRYLLQAPASELQQRREAVLNALQHLLGAVSADATTQEEWPRAMHAYRTLLRRLDESGNSDLRALFQESYLAGLMDDLLARTATPSADGLRALGSTAAVAVQQFRRMVQISGRLVDPDSPPLKYFLVALQLFYEGFTGSTSGFRLLYIARPLITSYGLYGFGGPDPATARLQRLILGRNTLAELLDCYLGCDCGRDRVRYQVLFDKILYDLDRAIDFYALGTRPQGDGEPEARAATFGLIATTVLDHIPPPPFPSFNVQAALTPEERKDHAAEIPAVQNRLNARLADLHALSSQSDAIHAGVVQQVTQAGQELLLAINVTTPPQQADVLGDPARARNMLQELCLQQDSEQQWASLLHTMAPSCDPSSVVLELTRAVLDVTRIQYFGQLHCTPIDATIPASLATSNAAYPFREHSEGGQ